MGTSETKEHGRNLRYQLVFIIAFCICGRLILGPLQILKSLDVKVFYIKGIFFILKVYVEPIYISHILLLSLHYIKCLIQYKF